MKQVISVSLGSPQRNFEHELHLLNTNLQVKRLGVNGDLAKAKELIAEFDGKVDAIGLGGIDLYFFVGQKRFTVYDALKLANIAKHTPVVCGAGLKNTLEAQVVTTLDNDFHWQNKHVLMGSSVDRFGMAKAFYDLGAKTLFGDFLFALNLPIPIYHLKTVTATAQVMLPVLTRLPFKWLYPTGEKQLKQTPKYSWAYNWAEVIAGDWHYIRKYAPKRLDDKIILTNTTTKTDIEFLQQRGVKTLITTTPRIAGRSLPTNLLEAALIAASGEFPLSTERYEQLIKDANLKADIVEL